MVLIGIIGGLMRHEMPDGGIGSSRAVFMVIWWRMNAPHFEINQLTLRY
jgi:hypothetical protein